MFASPTLAAVAHGIRLLFRFSCKFGDCTGENTTVESNGWNITFWKMFESFSIEYLVYWNSIQIIVIISIGLELYKYMQSIPCSTQRAYELQWPHVARTFASPESSPISWWFSIFQEQVDAQVSCTKFTQSNLYALQLKFFCTTKWILFVCILAPTGWNGEGATEKIALHKNLGKLVEKFAFEQNFKLMKWKSTSQLRLCLASVRTAVCWLLATETKTNTN